MKAMLTLFGPAILIDWREKAPQRTDADNKNIAIKDRLISVIFIALIGMILLLTSTPESAWRTYYHFLALIWTCAIWWGYACWHFGYKKDVK